MFKKTFEKQTRRVFKSLGNSKLMSDFYLAGGTALALQFGHRQSIDLDFFGFKNFVNSDITKILSAMGRIKILSEDKGTIHLVLDKVNISWLHYPYKLIYKPVIFQGVELADWKDIACMKISAISGRGSKKDFIDLFFILQKINLADLLNLFQRKYKGIDYSMSHILKSLIYFEDAEKEPMPMMFNQTTWQEMRNEIKKQVKQYMAK